MVIFFRAYGEVVEIDWTDIANEEDMDVVSSTFISNFDSFKDDWVKRYSVWEG